MATVHIAIGYCQGRGVGGAELPVRKSLISRSVQMTSTGTSTQCTLVATQAEIDNGALWFVTTDGTLDVTAGLNPTAANTNSHRVLGGGGPLEVSITTVGEKLAIKDA